VVVIEHNLDVIKTADWVLDLGPGGGVNGGKIIAEGPPERIAEVSGSATGHYLGPVLETLARKAHHRRGAQGRVNARRLSVDEPDLLAAK
jgi:excinuclease ABC subunit A